MDKFLCKRNNGLGLIEDFFTDFLNDGWQERSFFQDAAHYFIDEKTKEVVIIAQAPGFTKEDISIEVDATGITITGEITNEETKKKLGEKKFSYKMRKLGIDAKTVDANLSNGILEIRLKNPETKDSKKIPIK